MRYQTEVEIDLGMSGELLNKVIEKLEAHGWVTGLNFTLDAEDDFELGLKVAEVRIALNDLGFTGGIHRPVPTDSDAGELTDAEINELTNDALQPETFVGDSRTTVDHYERAKKAFVVGTKAHEQYAMLLTVMSENPLLTLQEATIKVGQHFGLKPNSIAQVYYRGQKGEGLR